MSAAALPPKGWNKDNGCFNDGCPDKKFQKFDLCSTCHKAGIETCTIIGKDKKSYKVLNYKLHSEADRLAANKAIKEGAMAYRHTVREVGMSAEEIDADYVALGYDVALQQSYENGMSADVLTGQKRPRSDSDPDPALVAAMSARVSKYPSLDNDECDEDTLINRSLLRSMQNVSADLRRQDRAGGCN